MNPPLSNGRRRGLPREERGDGRGTDTGGSGLSGSSVGAIRRVLEEDIIFGRLRPRERLVEDALMRRFGAKRHVVRQALVELERIGLVARERNKGAMVRDFALDEVEQIYAMRELLQGHAARLIPLPPDPALVGRLREIHREHGAAVARGNDLGAVYRLNNAFHDALFAACGNRYLAEAISHYAWLAHAIRSYRIADPVLLAQARDEHGLMIEALAAGDRERLVRLCVDHIKPSKEAYLAVRRVIEGAA
jgi:DNA-binding GntR family transcriptional regulator